MDEIFTQGGGPVNLLVHVFFMGFCVNISVFLLERREVVMLPGTPSLTLSHLNLPLRESVHTFLSARAFFVDTPHLTWPHLPATPGIHKFIMSHCYSSPHDHIQVTA